MPTRGDLEPSAELESSASDTVPSTSSLAFPSPEAELNLDLDDSAMDYSTRKASVAGCSLPSPEEVNTDEGEILFTYPGVRTVRRLSKSGLVVKYGRQQSITREEGLAMHLARKHIAEVPQFIGYYTQRGLGYLFMTFDDGQPLTDALFESWTTEQRSSLMSSLRQILTTLHSIPVPPSAQIGGVAGRSARLAQPSGRRPPSFATEASMIDFLVDALLQEYPSSPTEHRLRAMPTCHPLQFVHGDLAGRNILVKPGKVVALIDWEWSGWYPMHVQVARTRIEVRNRPSKVAEKVLELLPAVADEDVAPLVEFYACMEW